MPFHSDRQPVRFAVLLSLSTVAVACGSASPLPESPAHQAITEASAESNGEERSLTPIALSGDLITMMPLAVTSFGAVVHDGQMYTLGGYHGVPHEYDREGQSAALMFFPLVGDPDASRGWTAGPSLDAGLQSVALVSHGQSLYRVGGMRALNPRGSPSEMASLREFARLALPIDDTSGWEELPPLPEGRSSHDAAVIGDTIFVVGGWKLGGDAETAEWYDETWSFDLGERGSAWQSLSTPFRRRGLAVAATAGSLVAIGGLDPDREISSAVHVLDSATRQWRPIADYPGWGFGVAAVGVNGSVYASGLEGIVYRLDLETEQWDEIGSTAFPRFFHRLVAFDEQRLVALGGVAGMTTMGRNRFVELIDLSEGAERVSIVTFENPGRAKNRQGLFLHDDSLYVFGGNNSVGQHDFEADNFLSEAYSIYLPTLAVHPMASFPFARQTMATLVRGDSGWAVGGFGHDGESARSYGDVHVFDFDSGTWARREHRLPQSRTQLGLTDYEGDAWIFGGLDYDSTRPQSDHFRHLASVLRSDLGDLSAPFADAGIALPAPRRAFAGARLGDRYYIIGGMKENFQFVEDCIAYDFTTREWVDIPEPSRVRLSAEVAVLDGKLYLAGGSIRTDDGVVSEPSIEVFDPTTNEWSLLIEELPFETRHARLFAYHQRLLMFTTHFEDADLARLAIIRVD